MGMDDREEKGMNLLRLLKALWRRAWAIALTAVIIGAGALGCTAAFVAPQYRARALMYVNSSSSAGRTKAGISQSELSAAQSLVDTYIVILNASSTLNDVIAQTGVDYSYEELSKMVSAASVNSTEIFYIEVISPDPKEAALLANTIAQVLPEKIAAVVEGSSARVVDYAVEPSRRDSPNLALNTAVGMLLGGALACFAVAVLELMDKQIHDTDYLTQTYDIPVLAVIPDLLSAGDTDDYCRGSGR